MKRGTEGMTEWPIFEMDRLCSQLYIWYSKSFAGEQALTLLCGTIQRVSNTESSVTARVRPYG